MVNEFFGLPILSALGISSAVGGGVSAIVNYAMTRREFRKKSHTTLIESKLDLYSSIIYYFDKMKITNDVYSFLKKEESNKVRFSYTDDEWQEAVAAIDTKIQGNFYLMSNKIWKSWIWIKCLNDKKMIDEIKPELKQRKNKLIEAMREMRAEMLTEYENLRQEHIQLAGKGVEEIPGEK